MQLVWFPLQGAAGGPGGGGPRGGFDRRGSMPADFGGGRGGPPGGMGPPGMMGRGELESSVVCESHAVTPLAGRRR